MELIETFVLVAKMNYIKVLISCAVHLRRKLELLDVTNAFYPRGLRMRSLYGSSLRLHSEITNGNVCKTALYGLNNLRKHGLINFIKS